MPIHPHKNRHTSTMVIKTVLPMTIAAFSAPTKCVRKPPQLPVCHGLHVCVRTSLRWWGQRRLYPWEWELHYPNSPGHLFCQTCSSLRPCRWHQPKEWTQLILSVPLTRISSILIFCSIDCFDFIALWLQPDPNSHSQALWHTPAIQGTEDDTFKDSLDSLARA